MDIDRPDVRWLDDMMDMAIEESNEIEAQERERKDY